MEASSPVLTLPFVGPAFAHRLEKLGIVTVDDLLHHIPHRYLDFSHSTPIAQAAIEETVTVKGEVIDAKNQYTRQARKIQVITVKDQSGQMEIVFFNQPYLANTFKIGEIVSFSGKVGWWGRKKALIAPEFEKYQAGVQIHTGRLIPIYPETAGVSSKWLRRRIAETLPKMEVTDYLTPQQRKKYKLTPLSEALSSIHFPDSLTQAMEAKKRLAFDELLFLHLTSLTRKKMWNQTQAAYQLTVAKDLLEKFTANLPFKLTASQTEAIGEILSNLDGPTPMNRLLEGDVGSGKTVVAAAACFAAFANGYQSVVMAPTQILSDQHTQTLNSLFAPFKLRVAQITAHKKELGVGKADIVVGTHALIHSKITFDKVGLVIIDEQHKFGVEQRTHLLTKVGSKAVVPHTLTMTATPIPRTVALTLYGDLDLSTLDEMPKGRAKITTWLVPPVKREGAYSWIEKQIDENHTQAFIVCPLIEESQKENMKEVRAVTKEFDRLTKVFSHAKLGLLHGRLGSSEKEKVVEDFRQGKIDILVTTPVVEVGIDVPNATIMLIEGAERFGLAQLHQLRGRVGRGAQKSYCLVMTDSISTKVLTRLSALTQTLSGHELAELDLKLRGPGEVFGTRQSGFPELTIATWQDTGLIIQTRKLAEEMVATNQTPEVIAKLASLG